MEAGLLQANITNDKFWKKLTAFPHFNSLGFSFIPFLFRENTK
jgi:hypothetical protein